jgi:ABC-2 type transport system ATP-binding protein
VIISSHLLAMVEDICTRVLIIDEGKKRFCGTLDELKDKFVSSEQSATLEEIFLLVTEENSNQRSDARIQELGVRSQ